MNQSVNKILVVDDEADIIELLQYNLEKEGYEVATANDGKQAIEKAKTFMPEVVLMDIMMPVMDGVEAARQLRQNPDLKDTYILFLTARSEEYSEIAAFEAGADDYITKPIKPRALMSRIKAYFMRKTQKPEQADKLTTGDLTINRTSYTATYRGQQLTLPRKEFELLYFLVNNEGKVFSRDELLQKVWGVDVYVVERTVDVHIRKLREKINENYIKTLKGVGYMFSIEV